MTLEESAAADAQAGWPLLLHWLTLGLIPKPEPEPELEAG